MVKEAKIATIVSWGEQLGGRGEEKQGNSREEGEEQGSGEHILITTK